MLAIAIGGEIIFGAAIGMILSFVFVAAQWGGEMIGQQMGLNLGQTLNPQYGGGGSVVGDLYFFLTLLIFLSIGGHIAARQRRLRQLQRAAAPLRLGMNRPVLDTVISSIRQKPRWFSPCSSPPPCSSPCLLSTWFSDSSEKPFPN